MSKKVTLGGDRLGSEGKMDVQMHGYGTSFVNQQYTWKSSMAPGTLVPFMCEPLLNGDHMKLNIGNQMVRTLPTVGPLYGSFKMQLDVFKIPLRLYNAQLHNNELEIGNDMKSVKFPVINITAKNPSVNPEIVAQEGFNQQQINKSSLINYLGMSGLGRAASGNSVTRLVQAMPTLGYWDIYKNYYANKQEGEGVVITAPTQLSAGDIFAIRLTPQSNNIVNIPVAAGVTPFLELFPIVTPGNQPATGTTINGTGIYLRGVGLSPEGVSVRWSNDTTQYTGSNFTGTTEILTLQELVDNGTFQLVTVTPDGTEILCTGFVYRGEASPGLVKLPNEGWATTSTVSGEQITLERFDLKNIDDMRRAILSAPYETPYVINALNNSPYNKIYNQVNDRAGELNTASYWEMAGLGIKTYLSDRFNNWLKTEWIDGPNGINALTAIDTSSGSFNLDTLNLAQKMYNVLNRIALSGGSYRDWQEAVYGRKAGGDCEIPMYIGGASAEIIFNEVVSTADVENSGGENSLGTLGGRGTKAANKGGYISITADEPCFIMGIVSITPRLDYSQGNKWWNRWTTMDDLHKPELDGIGYQELITDEMVACDTIIEADGTITYKSAGKQPAWIQYTTNQNETHGTFANKNSEDFMVINRAYKPDSEGNIADLTTYVNPVIANNVFAVNELKSQNFWVFIDVDLKGHRVMSSRQIPNL